LFNSQRILDCIAVADAEIAPRNTNNCLPLCDLKEVLSSRAGRKMYVTESSGADLAPRLAKTGLINGNGGPTSVRSLTPF